jgi:ABC-type transport system substrate-binding protein
LISHRGRGVGIGRAGLTAAVAGLLVIAASVGFVLSQGPGKPSTSISTAPQRGPNAIAVGMLGPIGRTIDPAAANTPTAMTLLRNVDAGLIDFSSSSGQVSPALAINWTMGSGGAAWTFNLRHGVFFPSGVEFNATVEAYSVNRSMDHNKVLSLLIDSVIVIGPYQVEFVLTHSNPVTFVADIPFFPVDPTVAGKSLVNFTGSVSTEDPTGLGPYQMNTWTGGDGNGDNLTLKPNPHYWNYTSKVPKVGKLDVLTFSDKQSLLTALGSGVIDLAYVDASYGGFSQSDLASLPRSMNLKLWQGPVAVGGSSGAIGASYVGGVVLDSSRVFRLYLLSKMA